jgi:hypothetical protein
LHLVQHKLNIYQHCKFTNLPTDTQCQQYDKTLLLHYIQQSHSDTSTLTVLRVDTYKEYTDKLIQTSILRVDTCITHQPILIVMSSTQYGNKEDSTNEV